MSRAWIKLWVEDELNSEWRFKLTPAERSVWTDLRLLAGRSPVDGMICAGGRKIPLTWIAQTLNISVKILTQTLSKLEELGEVVGSEEGIKIVHWSRWQSEYGRQKKYRQPKPQDHDPDKYVKGKYGHMVRR